MSDPVNNNPEPVQTPLDESTLGYNLVEEKFLEGEWAGFKFFVPEFDKLDELVTKYGEESIVELCNQSVSNRIRQSVKNSLMKKAPPEVLKAEQEKVLSKTQGVLFSKEDAVAWKINFRDTDGTGLNSIQRQLNAAMKASNIPLVTELMGKINEAYAAELAKLQGVGK